MPRGRARVGQFIPGTSRRPIAHGTPGGYRAHHRHGEPMCDPCRDADRARRGTSPRRSARCGTPGGYSRHLRVGEPTCTPCRDAWNASHQQYMRRTGRVAAPTPRRIKPRREAA